MGAMHAKKVCVSDMIDINPRQLPTAWNYNRDKKLLSIFLFATPQIPTGLVSTTS